MVHERSHLWLARHSSYLIVLIQFPLCVCDMSQASRPNAERFSYGAFAKAGLLTPSQPLTRSLLTTKPRFRVLRKRTVRVVTALLAASVLCDIRMRLNCPQAEKDHQVLVCERAETRRRDLRNCRCGIAHSLERAPSKVTSTLSPPSVCWALALRATQRKGGDFVVILSPGTTCRHLKTSRHWPFEVGCTISHSYR